MSISIPLRQLDHATHTKIMKGLVFFPEPMKKKYGAPKFQGQALYCYKLCTDKINIPLRYAMLAGFKPEKRMEVSIPFKGSLWTGREDKIDQVAIVKEAIGHLTARNSCILNLATGTGKTVIAAALTSRMNRVTLFLVSSKATLESSIKVFSEFLDANIWYVGVKGQKNYENVEPGEANCPDVIVCMYSRPQKIPDWIMRNVGLMIVDEAHTFCTQKNTMTLLSFTPEYVVLLSATIERHSDSMHRVLYAIAGKERIKVRSLCKFEVIGIKTGVRCDNGEDLDKDGKPRFFNADKYFAMHPGRIDILISLLKNNPNNSVAVILRNLEPAMLLVETLRNEGISAVSYTGKDNELYEARVIVGTLQKIGTGFDKANTCIDYSGKPIDMVVFWTSIADPGCLTQVAGRGFRSDRCSMVHLIDDYRICKTHWKNAKVVYDENIRNEVHSLNIVEIESKLYKQLKEERRKKKLEEKRSKDKGMQDRINAAQYGIPAP